MFLRFSFCLTLLCALTLFGCDSNNGDSCLTVTPNEDYFIAGTAATTTFSPASKTYTVSNMCDEEVLLSVEEDVRWLDVDIEAFGGGSNEAGLLNPGTSVDVLIEVRYGTDNPERLDQLPAGLYEADVNFEDESNRSSVTRKVNLTVNIP